MVIYIRSYREGETSEPAQWSCRRSSFLVGSRSFDRDERVMLGDLHSTELMITMRPVRVVYGRACSRGVPFENVVSMSCDW